MKWHSFLHTKRTIQLDRLNVQNRSNAHPNPIRKYQASGFDRQAPKTHHQEKNRQPQENHFKHSPVGSLQFEVERAPQNIQKSVCAKQHQDAFLKLRSVCSLPSHGTTDGTQGKNKAPNDAKVRVWRLPLGVFEGKVPRA